MSLQFHPSDFYIYIVDDESSIRSFLVEAFKKWGFQVRAFPDGDATLEAMKAGDLPHVLFADIQMPGISGLGLARRSKEFSKEIEVVLMTAAPSVETALEALKLGVHDYLLKPFDSLEDVRRIVFHVCERIYLRLYNEYLRSELKLKNEEIRGLSTMADELSDVVDVARTIEIGCESLSKAFSNSPICFLQFIPKDQSLMVAARHPLTLFAGAQSKMLLPKEQTTSLSSIIDYLKEIEKDPDFTLLLSQSRQMNTDKEESPTENIWKAFPFVTRGIPRGVFAIQVEEWDEEIQGPLVTRYLQSLEKYFENALLHTRVLEMSVKDGLTGLYNVRAFRERFDHELRTSMRIAHPVSLLFFDVDHFKKYNDTNGHPAGDQILKGMADLLRKNFRSTDFLARYGGEEFCVILPHTDLESALLKAESFRKVVESCPFAHAESQPLGKVSVSIGVSEFPTHAAATERLIKLADEALYVAKKQSRNVVVCAEKDTNHIAPFESKHVSIGRSEL